MYSFISFFFFFFFFLKKKEKNFIFKKLRNLKLLIRIEDSKPSQDRKNKQNKNSVSM